MHILGTAEVASAKASCYVYAPVRVPLFWLYVLCSPGRRLVNAGMTGDWSWRVSAWSDAAAHRSPSLINYQHEGAGVIVALPSSTRLASL